MGISVRRPAEHERCPLRLVVDHRHSLAERDEEVDPEKLAARLRGQAQAMEAGELALGPRAFADASPVGRARALEAESAAVGGDDLAVVYQW